MPKNIRRHMHVNCECSQIKNLNKLRAIHKQRDNFSGFFKPPSHVGSFLVLSFGNFDQFLTPPIANVVYGRPPTGVQTLRSIDDLTMIHY